MTDFKNNNKKSPNTQSTGENTKSDATQAGEASPSVSASAPESNTKKDSGSTSTATASSSD